MRESTPLFPDPVHLLSSLCAEVLHLGPSRSDGLPFFASAVGSHPIQWEELDGDRLDLVDGAWAIGAVVEGRNQYGQSVVAALVVDMFGRQRSLVHQNGETHDIAVMLGDVMMDFRDALGLDSAA